MMGASEILSALTAHDARLVVEGDRMRVLFPSDRPPPSDLIDAAKANRECLRTLLLGDSDQRYAIVLAKLAGQCPQFIDPETWQQAVTDAMAFLARWGTQAAALNWTARELFGLHPVPELRAARYRRLARYDHTGLLWLLRGRSVVVLTAETAAIQTKSGGILTYRKDNKPGLGPIGDSLDDMGAAR
ncbi:MAG TPA: hypothetical protein VMV19_11205 [Xanthobacteraceae bacterium]|nr:hypothetical protein [Xanthobacteraceae bacterium]